MSSPHDMSDVVVLSPSQVDLVWNIVGAFEPNTHRVMALNDE